MAMVPAEDSALVLTCNCLCKERSGCSASCPGFPSKGIRAIADSSDGRLMNLPVKLQRELELSRIISGSSLSCVAEQRADRRDIVFVGDVEHVGDQFHVEAL